MKARLVSVMVFLLVGFSGHAQSLSGKEIFSGNCKACHSIGGGDIVGPDLAGVTARREADWIKKFVVNSQKMVAEGDELAMEVFNKYNKIAMPSHSFSDEDLNNLISYMDDAGQEANSAKEQSEATPAKPQEQAEVAVAEVNAIAFPFHVKVILGVLGVAAVLLSVIAAYLFRLLRS